MMEFQSPPTSLTETEESAREEFIKRLNFVNDLADAGQFLKFQWMRTEVSPVPLEIKFHVLEGDPIKARAEFEARSEHLESFHATDGCRFKAYGHRHKATTQHSAELTFGSGMVKYVVVWIEKDPEPEPEPEPELTGHFSVYGAESNLQMYVKCYCGWSASEPQGITAMRKLETAFGEHMRDAMIDAEVTPDA